jgi:ribose-phosphate pyrophosphokinase
MFRQLLGRHRQFTTAATAIGCMSVGLALGNSAHSSQSAALAEEDMRVYPKPATVVKQPKINGLKIFSGNANPELASNVAKLVGVELGKITVERFADGEVNVMVHENVRGKDVYIVQPTCVPVNENLMELLLMVSTMRRSSARRITAVIPYYGYARQDRKMAARVPISAADVARLLEAMGVDRVISVDLHCGQIQGFFGPRVPVDNLDGGLVGVSYFGNHELVNPVVVSPDAGGVARAKKFREWLVGKYGVQNTGLAMIIKQRIKANEIDKMDLVGNVEGSDCIIVDDMIDTAGTLCKAAQHLSDHGARNVYAFASHGLFNGSASEKIKNSALKEVVVVNTTPLPESCKGNDKIVQLDIAPLVAQAIQNIHGKKSVSMLFN